MCKDRSDKSFDQEVAHSHCLHFFNLGLMMGNISWDLAGNTICGHI